MSLDTIRKALFWIVGTFFFIDSFIRTFINEYFMAPLREVMVNLSLPIKIVIMIVAVLFVIWTGIPVFRELKD